MISRSEQAAAACTGTALSFNPIRRPCSTPYVCMYVCTCMYVCVYVCVYVCKHEWAVCIELMYVCFIHGLCECMYEKKYL